MQSVHSVNSFCRIKFGKICLIETWTETFFFVTSKWSTLTTCTVYTHCWATAREVALQQQLARSHENLDPHANQNDLNAHFSCRVLFTVKQIRIEMYCAIIVLLSK